MKDDLKIQGSISLVLTDKNGNIKDNREIENTITNAGFAEIANLMGNVSSPAYFTYLAIGTGTTPASASQTALVAELATDGLSRASATVTRATTTVTNDTLQLVKAFTSTGGTHAVTEVGIFNAASVGTMLGRQIFDAINMGNTDVLTITYKVKIS